MKRFTETTKWADPWFQKLPLKYKAFWSYINDNCDAGGVWRCNLPLASFQIGEKVRAREILKFFPMLEDIGGGKWWITDFCEFQYRELSPECKPHQNVMKVLKSHGLLERVWEGYAKGMARVEEKEKETEQAKERSVSSSAEATRIAAIFKRPSTTPWSEHEIKAFKAIQPIDVAELELVEKYYAREKSNPKNALRQSMFTFLTNYRGEVDRARTNRFKKRDDYL